MRHPLFTGFAKVSGCLGRLGQPETFFSLGKRATFFQAASIA
ncbi:hypothetical protein [Kingella oralis]|jgi:hypothetical protein